MPFKFRKSVGVLGLGIIGLRAAAALRAAGYKVCVWNRSPKPAPNFLPSPLEVAHSCEVLQLFLADATAVMQVLGALSTQLTPKHTVICSATIGPSATLEAARFVEERGAKFLDAPFTGSKGAAERAQLVYYIGGDGETYLPVKPILEATSKAIVRCGAVGEAALLKVVTNQIAAVSVQVMSEALAIVRKAGLPAESLAAALEHNACKSGTMELKLPKMLNGDYEPHFSLKHMFKDVQLGIELASALGLDTPSTAVTAGVMYGALQKGWGEDDFATIFRTYEDELATPATEPEAAPPLLGEAPAAPEELTVSEALPPAEGEEERPA